MNRDISILDAWDHPQMFAPHFRGGETWAKWRTFCAALFALTPDERMLALFQEHTGRQTWPTKPFSEAALVVGRRGGKSRVLALLGTFLATFRDYSPYLGSPHDLYEIVR